MKITGQLESRTQGHGTNSNLMLQQQPHATIVTSCSRQNRTRKSNQIFGTSISMSQLVIFLSFLTNVFQQLEKSLTSLFLSPVNRRDWFKNIRKVGRFAQKDEWGQDFTFQVQDMKNWLKSYLHKKGYPPAGFYSVIWLSVV